MNKPTLIITGVSGLIGSAAARRLSDRYQIVGFDIQRGRSLPREVYFVHVDLSSEESVRAGVAEVKDQFGEQAASVIHLAAYYSFSGEPSPLYDKITVQGTGRLLDALAGLQVEQLVFSSTMLVHAPCRPGQKIDESWPLEPKWDYPQSKVKTEQLLRDRHGDIPVVILRIAGVYDEMCHSVPIAHQIQRIYERKMTGWVYPGDASHGQAFIHREDLVDALERVVEMRSSLPPETTLLLGEPETLGYAELQRRLGQLIHRKEWNTYRIPKLVARAGAWVQDHLPGEDPFIKPWMVDLADDHYELDISKASALLGWQPRHQLADVLPEMVRRLKHDPSGWYRANGLEPPTQVERPAETAGAS